MTLWEPKDWERWVKTLLTTHYPPGEFQEVPDEHGGDFGIEGFSLDGCAYQCYAPREPISVAQRYEKLRQKIYADTEKLAANQQDLMRLFGEVVIRRWMLVVPRFDSAKLLQYSSDRSLTVRGWSLPFVSGDFRILVQTDELFSAERRQLEGLGLGSVWYEEREPEEDPAELIGRMNDGSTLLRNLATKAAKLPLLRSMEKRKEFMSEIARSYVAGQAVLDRFKTDHPEIYEQLLVEKRTRARSLRLETLVSDRAPGERLPAEIKLHQTAIAEKFPSIHRDTVTTIALEAVADWILRCPLDFPEPGVINHDPQ